MPGRRKALSALALAVSAFVTSPRGVAQTSPPPANPGSTDTALFAVEFRTGSSWDGGKQPHEQSFFREHSANLKRLRDEGRLVVGARYSDKGFVVLGASSESEARSLIDVDPSVQNKVFAYEIYAFNVFYSGCLATSRRRN